VRGFVSLPFALHASIGSQDEIVAVTCTFAVREDIPCQPPSPSASQFASSPSNSLKFEELISATIEETKEYPEIISETGKIGLPHKGLSSSSCLIALRSGHPYPSFAEIMRKMGEVFLLRANIAAVGSVLDSPEVFWVSRSA